MTAATVPRTSASRPAVAGGFALRTLAEIAAVAQVLLGGAVVLAAAERPSMLTSKHRGAFAPWFAGPLRGLLPSLTRNQAVLHRDLRAALLIMLAAWLVVVLGGRVVRASVVIGAVVALHAIFLLSPPFRLTDLFNYLGYARLDVVHHLNPYVHLPLRQHRDPVYAYSNWHRLHSPYGPLFTLLLLPTAKLPLPVAYWTYKLLATAASLGLLAAVWSAARRLGRPPAAAVAFVGLNPVVLVYALGGKHNDHVMMSCLMAGGLLVLARREVLGGATLAAAVAIKASAGLLAPLVALGAPRRWRAAAGIAAGAIVLSGATLVAFGPHLPDLHDQDRLVGSYSFPNLIGYASGHGGADAAVRRAATLVLVSGVAVCAVVAWRRRSWPTPAGWAGLLAVVCVSWLMPWYVLWVLPFAALSGSRTLRATTVVMAVWITLIWSGVVPQLAHAHGIYPSRTAVGRANHRYIDSLLLDHPRGCLGRAHILRRRDGAAPPHFARPAGRAAHRGRLPGGRDRHRAGAGRGVRPCRRVDRQLARRSDHGHRRRSRRRVRADGRPPRPARAAGAARAARRARHANQQG
jgi:alpha-1,6-mannosyltransferase